MNETTIKILVPIAVILVFALILWLIFHQKRKQAQKSPLKMAVRVKAPEAVEPTEDQPAVTVPQTEPVRFEEPVATIPATELTPSEPVEEPTITPPVVEKQTITPMPPKGKEIAPQVHRTRSPKVNSGAVPLPEIFESASAPHLHDDLTLIEGVGPKINTILQGYGITTFSQLADLEAVKIKDIITKGGVRLGDTTTWPAQAKLAAEGKLEELKTLQDSLKGGKSTS